ncbi:MAG: hypothetical protein KJT03_05175 [Verrucomicrobiae bacterium]|nr:hypothetical protein [Verrucomicrobiae bacterium]
MEVIFYALLTVLSWGIWLAPSQTVEFDSERVRTFYVALANLIVALLVGWAAGLNQLDLITSLSAGAGGLIWALSGFCAFYATSRLGIARAMGIWAPLNVVVSFIWGFFLFGELKGAPGSRWLMIGAAVLIALIGIRFILFASESGEQDSTFHKGRMGIAAALGAGLLWGTYFIPLRVADVPVWVSVLPLSLGIFAGSTLGVLLGRDSLRLNSGSDYLRTLSTGVLWGVGNYGSLKLMELIGTGKGFTIAQMCVVVNALVGIYWLQRPKPGTPAARRALLGVFLATIGGVVLGVARYS